MKRILMVVVITAVINVSAAGQDKKPSFGVKTDLTFPFSAHPSTVSPVGYLDFISDAI
jgi:hypothetical protein